MKKLTSVVVFIGGVFLGSWQNSQFSIIPDSVSACDYCILTRGFTPPETLPGFGLRVDARYTLLNSVFSGTNQVINHSGEKETHFTTQITMFYNFSDKFSLVGILPVPRRSVSVNARAEHHDGETEIEAAHGHDPVHRHTGSGTSFNLGDLNILGRYTFLRLNSFKQSTTLTLETGIKIPTGSTNSRDAEGNFLDAHIQPGTGSWNFLIGFSVNHANDYFGLSSNLLYSINTTGEAGDDNYRYGNWLNADLTAKYEMFASEMRNRNLFLTLGINGEFRGKEEIDGQGIKNTGGKVLYIVPGFQFMISPAITIEASFQYPFHHNLDGGEQLGESLKTFFGVNYLL
ncbi:MAG: transporter [bacterium]